MPNSNVAEIDAVEISQQDKAWVLSTLEPGQLVKAKQKPIPRRPLKGPELAILTLLRIYLVFMMIVVAYQVWVTTR
jgi:hypothetical protein